MAETWIDQGGYLSNIELNKTFVMAAQPLTRFRQFCDFKSALGKHKGNQENFLKVSNVGTYGGTLTETNTMHETTQTKAWGTATITEYGNSIPFTQKVTTLSRFDLEKIVKDGLLDDAVKCLDGLAEREFNGCQLRYVGTGTAGYVLTTNGTTTATATSALNTYHLRKMILELNKRNVPGWQKADGGYVLIGSHEACEGLMGALESVYQYTESGVKRLFSGEIGKYFDTRVVADGFASRFVYEPDSRAATAVAGMTGTAASTKMAGYSSTTAWSAAANVLSGPAYLFGSPTVMEAIATNMEVRVKEVTDYGRSHGIAWYYLGGFELIWATGDDARIIKWDSA